MIHQVEVKLAQRGVTAGPATRCRVRWRVGGDAGEVQDDGVLRALSEYFQGRRQNVQKLF